MTKKSISLAVSEDVAELDLPPGSLILVAFSGGPDSTALLAALAVSAATRGLKPRAIYVDHGLRSATERDLEREHVGRICDRLGVRLTIARVAVGTIKRRAEERKSGIEAAARHYRYAAIRACAGRFEACAVYLGHTLDDQIETILMRIFGGSASGGLGGMRPVSGIYRRPLLGYSKSQLLDYLRVLDLSYSVDSTNGSDDFTRNRIRHALVPVLDTTIPGWKSGLTLLSTKARLDEDALRLHIDSSPGRFVRDEDARTSSTVARSFFGEAEALRIRILLDACSALSEDRRLSWRMIREAANLDKTGKKHFEAGGFVLERTGDRLILRRGLDFPACDGYFVEVRAPGRYGTRGFSLVVAWSSAECSQGLREGSFSFPLAVRSRLPGDSIMTEFGLKRLDDMFAGWKITARVRHRIMVVEDREGIVAVFGSRFGGKNRFRFTVPRNSRFGIGEENAACSVHTGRTLSIEMKGARVSDGF